LNQFDLHENRIQLKNMLKKVGSLFYGSPAIPRDLSKALVLLNKALIRWPQQNNFYILRGRIFLEQRKAQNLLQKSKRIKNYEKRRLADCALKDFSEALEILKTNEQDESRVNQRR
jgi:hypothetical protein